MKIKKPFTVFFSSESSSRITEGVKSFKFYKDAIQFAEAHKGAYRKITKFEMDEMGGEIQIFKKDFGDVNKF